MQSISHFIYGTSIPRIGLAPHLRRPDSISGLGCFTTFIDNREGVVWLVMIVDTETLRREGGSQHN